MFRFRLQNETEDGMVRERVTNTQSRDRNVAPGDDEVQHVTGIVRRHVLNTSKRLQLFRETNGIDVIWVVHVDISHRRRRVDIRLLQVAQKLSTVC